MSDRIFRRPKRNPKEDFWHVLRVGLALAVVIFVLGSAMGAVL
jgi:hypothetical protein